MIDDFEYETPLFEESFYDFDRGKDFNCFRNVLANLSDNLQKAQNPNKVHSNFTPFYDGPSKLFHYDRTSSVYQKHRTYSIVQPADTNNFHNSQTRSQVNFEGSCQSSQSIIPVQQSSVRSVTPHRPVYPMRATDFSPEQFYHMKSSDAFAESSMKAYKPGVKSAEQSPLRTRNGFRIRVTQKIRESNDAALIRADWAAGKADTSFREVSITNIVPPFTDATPRLVSSSRKRENLPHRRLDPRARMTLKLYQFNQKLSRESQKINDTTPRQFINLEEFQDIFGKPSQRLQKDRNLSEMSRNSTTSFETDGRSGPKEARLVRPAILEKEHESQALAKLRAEDLLERIDKLMKEGKLASLKDKQVHSNNRPTVRQVSALDSSENCVNMHVDKAKRKMNETHLQMYRNGVPERARSNTPNPSYEGKKSKILLHSNRTSPQKSNIRIEYSLTEHQTGQRIHSSHLKHRR